MWVASQKWRALANIIRVNLNGVFVWPALSNRLERKAILEEISGRFTPEEVEEMLQHVSQRPFGFLFADLKTTDPDATSCSRTRWSSICAPESKQNAKKIWALFCRDFC